MAEGFEDGVLLDIVAGAFLRFVVVFEGVLLSQCQISLEEQTTRIKWAR